MGRPRRPGSAMRIRITRAARSPDRHLGATAVGVGLRRLRHDDVLGPSRLRDPPPAPARPRRTVADGGSGHQVAARARGHPSIGVTSSVLDPLDASGQMSVPPPGPDYDRVGWYRHSPTPGEIGRRLICRLAQGPSQSVALRSGGRPSR
jgi:hypothetical protein